MKSLGSLDGKGTPPMSSATGEPSRLPPFVIAIKSLHEAGACHHLGCPVQLPSSLSLPHASTLPASYRELCDHQLTTLRRTYCRLYCSHTSNSPLFALTKPRPAPTPSSAAAPCGVCGEHSVTPTTSAATQKAAATLLASARQMVVDGATRPASTDRTSGTNTPTLTRTLTPRGEP